MIVEELRIGNWIDFKSTPGQYEQVQDIQTYDLKTPSVNRIAITDIVGIPLSEEWLENLGFEKELITGQTDKFFYFKSFLGYNEIHGSWWINNKRFGHILYVHRLQNIYHALTRKELKLIK